MVCVFNAELFESNNGEIDIDNLCSELRAKAKCSEGGAVVDKKDVDKILGSVKT